MASCPKAIEEQKAKCVEAIQGTKSKKIEKSLNDAKLRDNVNISLPTIDEEEDDEIAIIERD